MENAPVKNASGPTKIINWEMPKQAKSSDVDTDDEINPV